MNKELHDQRIQELRDLCSTLADEFGLQETSAMLSRFVCANQAAHTIIHNEPQACFSYTIEIKGEDYTLVAAKRTALALAFSTANNSDLSSQTTH